MKRPIKFRGRDKETGKMVYGDHIVLFVPYIHYTDDKGTHFNVAVEPDSIAQLVGYDKDGNEVYEGDIIVDENDEEMPAMLLAIQFDGKLKEAEEDEKTD